MITRIAQKLTAEIQIKFPELSYQDVKDVVYKTCIEIADNSEFIEFPNSVTFKVDYVPGKKSLWDHECNKAIESFHNELAEIYKDIPALKMFDELSKPNKKVIKAQEKIINRLRKKVNKYTKEVLNYKKKKS